MKTVYEQFRTRRQAEQYAQRIRETTFKNTEVVVEATQRGDGGYRDGFRWNVLTEQREVEA